MCEQRVLLELKVDIRESGGKGDVFLQFCRVKQAEEESSHSEATALMSKATRPPKQK